jgi:hypothetical protein
VIGRVRITRIRSRPSLGAAWLDKFAVGRAATSAYPLEFMQHLWIDLDLCPAHADDRSAWPFRFQRVVSPRDLRGHSPIKYHNVGHYSVIPDYIHLANVPVEHVTCYLLSLIYNSTDILEHQSRRLGESNVEAFRSDFRRAVAPLLCQDHSLA